MARYGLEPFRTRMHEAVAMMMPSLLADGVLDLSHRSGRRIKGEYGVFHRFDGGVAVGVEEDAGRAFIWLLTGERKVLTYEAERDLRGLNEWLLTREHMRYR